MSPTTLEALPVAITTTQNDTEEHTAITTIAETQHEKIQHVFHEPSIRESAEKIANHPYLDAKQIPKAMRALGHRWY